MESGKYGMKGVGTCWHRLSGAVTQPLSQRLLLLLCCFMLVAVRMKAYDCGSVDYSQGSSALHDLAAYILTVMQYVVYILYAVASLLSLYSASVIYIKLNTGEEGLLKPCLMLFGAILFLGAVTYVMPAFFGIHHYDTGGTPWVREWMDG